MRVLRLLSGSGVQNVVDVIRVRGGYDKGARSVLSRPHLPIPFAALLVNQAIVPVVIYSYIEALEGFPVLFQGQYGDFETAWYNKVMVTIISTAIVNIVAFPLGAALPNIAAAASRAVFGCCAPSQKKLN